MNRYEVTIWREGSAETVHCMDVQMQENFIVLVQESGTILGFASHDITGFEVHPLEAPDEVAPWESEPDEAA
jgi:hypothetical protein